LDAVGLYQPSIAEQGQVGLLTSVEAVAVVDTADAAGQRLIVTPALGGVTLLGDPVVEGGGGEVKDPEDGLDPEAATMGGDKAHDRRRVGSSSCAK
jgi:hypothetical protein